MNYETGTFPQKTGEAESDMYDAEGDVQRKKRRNILIAAGVAVLVLGGGWYAMSKSSSPAPTAAQEQTKGAASAPAVTVIVPGRAQVDHVITATGMIAARREMPVGSVGEGGQVVRVLVEPGQWVRQGQVLATIDRQVQVPQLEQLSAQIRVAEADARLAQSELDRANALVSRGFISTADVERKTATRDSANARVRVARAQLTEARARVSRLDIRAPDAGLILTRQVEPGQVVGAGSGVLFRMARGGEMELLANVSETEIPNISAGARADVTPVGSTQGFTGQVWQVSPIINAETRQGVARIALSYAPGLRPGGFAEARIVSGSGQATLLPESAVLNDQKGSYVYVVGADNKVQRVDVTVGQVSDAGVSVTGGISGNERIVLSAGGFLNPGDAVRPVTQRRQ